MTWLVYMIGAAIGGRMTFTANDEHDILDGDLVVRVSMKLHHHFARIITNGTDFRRLGTTIDEFD